MNDKASTTSPVADPVVGGLPHKWVGIDDGLAEKKVDGRIFDVRDGCLLFDVPPEYRELVVTAVNSHDSLLKERDKLRAALKKIRDGFCSSTSCHTVARAALTPKPE